MTKTETETGRHTIMATTDYRDLYYVNIDRDYGHDEGFSFETLEEARKCFTETIGKPDVRRVWLSGPDASDEDEWSLS